MVSDKSEVLNRKASILNYAVQEENNDRFQVILDVRSLPIFCRKPCKI